MIRLLYLLFVTVLFAETVYIVPFRGCGVESLFYHEDTLRDEISKPFYALREALEKRGYTVKFTHDGKGLEEADAVISFENYAPLLEHLQHLPKEKCLLFCFEPPVVDPTFYEERLCQYFGKIFVMFDDLVDNRRYFKFHYPQPRLEMQRSSIGFEKKKFCIMIAANKDSPHPQSLYAEKRNLVQFFERLFQNLSVDDLDIYGPGWWGPLWKGTLGSKWDAYQKYRFAICYENTGTQKGYITEKIFDAFVGGSVPIYLGADNVCDYIPKECFIDRRDYDSDDALYRALKNISPSTYEKYLDAIERFMQSPEAQKFSTKAFVDLILSHL